MYSQINPCYKYLLLQFVLSNLLLLSIFVVYPLMHPLFYYLTVIVTKSSSYVYLVNILQFCKFYYFVIMMHLYRCYIDYYSVNVTLIEDDSLLIRIAV